MPEDNNRRHHIHLTALSSHTASHSYQTTMHFKSTLHTNPGATIERLQERISRNKTWFKKKHKLSSYVLALTIYFQVTPMLKWSNCYIQSVTKKQNIYLTTLFHTMLNIDTKAVNSKLIKTQMKIISLDKAVTKAHTPQQRILQRQNPPL